MKSSTDIAFSPSVKSVQTARGSRTAYSRLERHGGFETEVTSELRAFLAQIDSAFLATASADGQPYVQHRGGAKGFIRALDAHTLAFVDFIGNRQFISTGNLLENNRMCLFLIDYASRQRVKIWGTAKLVAADAALLARLGTSGRAKPEQVIVISVKAWDLNCPQHIPHKLDAASVVNRIAELEAENARLRAQAQGTISSWVPAVAK